MSIYEPGERVEAIADIFPAKLVPLPPGVPSGVKIRAVVTERCLSIAWQIGRTGPLSTKEFGMEPAQTAGTTWRGGWVGPYELIRGKGCACRGSSPAVSNWRPFPDQNLVTRRPARIPGVPRSAPVIYRRVR
jgi:hypothetical protein